MGREAWSTLLIRVGDKVGHIHSLLDGLIVGSTMCTYHGGTPRVLNNFPSNLRTEKPNKLNQSSTQRSYLAKNDTNRSLIKGGTVELQGLKCYST